MATRQPKKTELEKRMEAEMAAAREAAARDHEDAAVEGSDQQKDVGAELSAALAERDELQDQLLRARAEYENARKRMLRDMDRVRRTAAETLITDLLPVLDHLALALQHADDVSGGFAEGVEMVLKQFCETLSKHGVQPIPAEGQPFDPNVHEAMMQRPSEEVEAGMVLDEFQKGYTLGGVVLRPAKVIVSAGPEGPPACEENAAAGDTAVEVDVVSSEDDSDRDASLGDL